MGNTAQHPRQRAACEHRTTECAREAQGSVRFFVVGDIGHAGPGRQAVAKAMQALQQSWTDQGGLLASFVVATGDQVYGGATDAAFDRLEDEMLQHLPLPWVTCLGNHDAKGSWAGWHWHRQRHGKTGASGWSWVCPAPAYSVEDVLPGMTGPVDLIVINTNKYVKFKSATPPAHGAYQRSDGREAAPFYTSDNHRWWREQKWAVEQHLCTGQPPCNGGRWRVVLGHHPCEYAHVPNAGWKEWAEHNVPLWNHGKTFFMRGGYRAHSHRWGLAHIIRRGADLYLCGHQHLLASMTLRASRRRKVEETRCTYAIVGSSSKTEQDKDDFADDATQGESSSGCEGDEVHQTSPTTTTASANKRYEQEWVCPDRLGFAVVEASAEREYMTVTFYGLSNDNAAAEVLHTTRIAAT
eukprot:TRINITY_DN28176_c0_g1_i1.p1 TRINITY_DN28176_c0_g1~~TRINITY_DN28176_c0_g1_i1.p1  ORF type:complete len:410 (+),score=66.43 TRINITY_DN28176_c0_g1_i1:46-1275(+)